MSDPNPMHAGDVQAFVEKANPEAAQAAKDWAEKRKAERGEVSEEALEAIRLRQAIQRQYDRLERQRRLFGAPIHARSRETVAPDRTAATFQDPDLARVREELEARGFQVEVGDHVRPASFGTAEALAVISGGGPLSQEDEDRAWVELDRLEELYTEMDGCRWFQEILLNGFPELREALGLMEEEE